MTPIRLGPFHILRHVSSGPSGDVYECSRPPANAKLIVKMMHASSAAEEHARFEREALAYVRLRTPHTPRLIERGTVGARAYFALEWVAGPTLRELLTAGTPLHPYSALTLARALFVALEGVHGSGIIHRDVKPENVIAYSPNQVALVDFGIAWIEGVSDGLEALLTTEDAVLGTLAYASPEQLDAAAATVAGDLYASGVLAYELLSGRLPFEGPTGAAVLAMKRCREAPPLGMWTKGIPNDVEELIARLLARAPERRPASATEVVHLLDACMETR